MSMDLNVFDVIGPVMIGPSSSHTAGAVRLGRLSRMILGEEPKEADIFFHGSFAQTYRGHGTDLAVVAGLLGLSPADERIRDVWRLADARGLTVKFYTAKLGDVHPNTVKIVMRGQTGAAVTTIGSSIGGGQAVITRINSFAVEIAGDYFTILTCHRDRPGIVARVTQILAENDINIAQMRVSRSARGAEALMIIETDQAVPRMALDMIGNNDGVQYVKLIEPI